ncbi:colicin uptake protein TolR [Leminorella richardii]|uniref:Tol-Pal system protein TolR n=1 Tax=Leminorella richardii TaxID=158841 RepID=A0A2X4URZ9_9GAMM|nr:colicin uptake protein TolR [Leminorella richardii]SQI41591.1 colicin uptake protein TolR [Leminorella richardii]
MAYKRSSRRHGAGKAAEINIVPLLDVLLVLLLIFMATAPIITQSVEVDLPEASDSKTVSTDNKPPVIVEVSGVGQYTLVIDKDRMSQLPPEQVVAEVERIHKEDPKTVFLIGGAKEVPYDEVIKALNMLHRAGVTSVGLMTQPI